MRQLFCDLDGVLADFDGQYEAVAGHPPPSRASHDDEWRAIVSSPGFYNHMLPMWDMQELWSFIRHFNPIIITGVPSSASSAAEDKRKWVSRYIDNFGPPVKVITCAAADKSKFMVGPGDIIIDDWPKHRSAWLEKGGIWINHTSAQESIKLLAKELLK